MAKTALPLDDDVVSAFALVSPSATRPLGA